MQLFLLGHDLSRTGVGLPWLLNFRRPAVSKVEVYGKFVCCELLLMFFVCEKNKVIAILRIVVILLFALGAAPRDAANTPSGREISLNQPGQMV